MAKDTITLSVGSIIFGDSHYHGLSMHKIYRVTNTQAIFRNRIGADIRIKRKFVESTNEIGAKGWSQTDYYPHTDELEYKYKLEQGKRKMKRLYKNIDFSKLELRDYDSFCRYFEKFQFTPK